MAGENKNLMRHARKGLNIFYYGKGKGKTTAVIGLAVRALGAGMDVFILQFVKAKRPKDGAKLQSGEWPVSSEIDFFENINPESKKIGTIQCQQVGIGFVGILGDKKEKQDHVAEARKGLEIAAAAIKSDKYDLIILDELVSALELDLISESDILDIIKSRPKHLHLAYTGHDKFNKIIDASDLVSEIAMIKHPYYEGKLAQKGIDF
jgi:cob(I)alamin adenosyltransferase